MKNDNGNKPQSNGYYMPTFMSIGISIGVAIGAGINNIPMCMCIGLAIGLCVGVGLDAQNRKKNDDSADSQNEDHE